MTRLILVFFLSLFSLRCSALDNVSLKLESVRLSDLVQVVYGDIFKRNFLIDTPLLLDDSVVTFNLFNVAPSIAESDLKQLLDLHGYSVDAGTVVRVVAKLKSDPVKDSFVYRPRYRDVSYLVDILSGIVPASGFVTKRSGGYSMQALSGNAVSSGSNGSTVNVNGNNTGSGLNALADKNTDVMVYYGEHKDIVKLEALIDKLDIPVSEVVLDVVVYEVSKSRNDSSALDLAFSILKTKVGVTLTNSVDATNSAFVKFHGIGMDFSALYSALSSDSRFKELSTPSVRLSSGGHARFSVGQEVPILGSVSYDQSGRPIQSVTYKDSGVILDLTANVRGKSTDLTVNQEISNFQNTVTGVNTTPTLVKRQLTTSVSVREDDFVVLGGLNQSINKNTNIGLSFLPGFMRSKSGDDETTEIILLLRVQRI
jgi:type II secretory pathway component GspD/PulD (secretin)